ncbi:S9 family peptidase [Luminiphilus sp.]|nr:S9 family peptidase [Luminiphilus sp.]
MQSIKLKRRHKSRFLSAVSLVICTFFSLSIFADETARAFGAMDVFELEWASDPQISPDGQEVIYRRMGFDIMKDKRRGNLWRVRADGENHQKLTNFEGNETSPQWSPDGQRIAYVRNAGKEGAEIYVHWLVSGHSARITRIEGSPSHLRWSPSGAHIAFAMTAKNPPPVLAKRPSAPEGAKWADKPRVTDRLYHERDGSGYVEPGFSHVYVVPAEGGTPRQVSEGNFHHRKPEWRSDGQALFVTGNRSEDWQYDFRNSEVYTIDLASGNIQPMTSISGPDDSPLPSPDGQWVAWLGFTDKRQAYQVTRLRIAKADGSGMKELLLSLDRSIDAIHWATDAKGLYYQYDDKGRTKIGYVTIDNRNELIADNLGGTSIGRPYGGGSFSVSAKGDIAYTHTRPEFPADVAIATPNGPRKITHLNSDLLDHRALGETRELWWESRVDGLQTQGWITLPPDFDPAKKYPLLVENHGGPISNYGERFSPEIQLYAAAGYVVFFPNARGSTGYGEEFGNLLYHNYPGEDYNDVMDGLDAVINQGFIDPEQLYVTGGSAGGIMTAWMIGKNNRFRAAAVIKPVMNWYSKTLNADNWFYYFETRIPGTPWTRPDDYLRFSPISLVGNVTTPTLVMVGLDDLRTPPSQAKQLYHALKYRKIPTVLVELPGASHFIAKKPSQLIDKIDNILAWFERYKDNATVPEESSSQ